MNGRYLRTAAVPVGEAPFARISGTFERSSATAIDPLLPLAFGSENGRKASGKRSLA